MNERVNLKEFEYRSSPHLHSKFSTTKVMWLVNLSLLPCLISGVIFFGPYQLIIVLTAIVFSILTEFLIQKFTNQKITITDGSAFLTGLLLALTLPPNFSLTATALGSIFAIGIGKQVFGGLGYNIFNPALAGRAFLQAAFPVEITTWTKPAYSIDAISSATPLAAFKYDKVLTELKPLIVGNIGGCIGETSSIAILIGGIFLILIGIVNYRIPLAMIVGIFLFGGIFNFIDASKYPPPIFHLFSGGFMLGAFFMATDYVTSPVTSKGMWIYGLGISLIIIIIRLFGGVPEGVMYSILVMNAFVPLINRYTIPKPFGLKE